MSFLKRTLREGIRKGVGDAISKAVQQVIEPTATDFANRAADSLNQAAGQSRQTSPGTGGLEGAFANLQRSVESYATEAAKNVKICPSCNAASTADKKFCPNCGAALPENTVAQASVCPGCGKQNTVGTKFCSECGTKLPGAIQEEEAELERSRDIMARWDTELAPFPKWNCGGLPVEIERADEGLWYFTVEFKGDSFAARQAVRNYLSLAGQSGFRPEGMYPSEDNLYKQVDGISYYFDTEHAFDGDSACPVIAFAIREPEGGYNYVKPEPKKPAWMDLFK